jgi:hypothetical protein
MAIASDIDKRSRYTAGKLPRAHLPYITIRGLPRGVRRAYLITTDWFLKRKSANGDRLLGCRKDGGEILEWLARLLFKHLIRLKASSARWIQLYDLAAHTTIISLFCRTDVPDRSRRKNTVRPWPRRARRLNRGFSINRNHFASVCFDRSDHNNRFCRTAEPLITWALEKSKSVIFSEDDVIFERDAVEWFERALAHPMVPASERLGDCWRIEVF